MIGEYYRVIARSPEDACRKLAVMIHSGGIETESGGLDVDFSHADDNGGTLLADTVGPAVDDED
ncbi:MAG: hypothetical protein WCD38_11690 [Candidatus Tumulicola sp.]